MKSVVHEVYITCMMYIVEEQKQASASRYFKGFIRKKHAMVALQSINPSTNKTKFRIVEKLVQTNHERVYKS